MDPRRTTWRRTAVALAALLLTLAASRVAAADTITLMWDANPDPSVSGYIVYVGTLSKRPGGYYEPTGYNYFNDNEGYPAMKPPWGEGTVLREWFKSPLPAAGSSRRGEG